MSTIGSQTTTVFIKKASVKIGSDTLAVARNLTARWGNDIVQEEVIGTDVPLTATGVLKGTVELEYVYITDSNLATLIDPGADGQVPETTIQELLVDTAATPKTDTWTFKSRLGGEIVGRTGGYVVARLTGPLTARPTRAQA